MAANKLSDKAKFFVLKRLAAFEKPTEIAEAVKAEFGVDMSRQNVEFYDPAKNSVLGKQWLEFWVSERKKFIEEVDAQPLQHLAYRQKVRQRALDQSGRNPKMMLQIADSAAKDAGGAYTNKTEVTGTVEVGTGDVKNMSTEQLLALQAELATAPQKRHRTTKPTSAS